MTCWFALSLLILLSANAVFSNDYVDPLIDNDPYLRNCITSSGTGDLKQDGVKKIFSNSECYAKTKIQFKVEDYGSAFYVYNKQGENHILPAKIRYKFGECYDVEIEIKKDDEDKVVYTLHKPDGSTDDLEEKFMFLIKRRGYGEFGKPDFMQVLKKDYTEYISKDCNAFERDIDDIKAPTLIDFEQEILEGVPDFTLIWNASLGVEKKYFGTATAKEIKLLETTTSTTTTTANPTTSTSIAPTVTSTTTETSTIAPTTINSNSSLSITDAPKTDEMSKWWLIFVIIVEFVIILLLVLALIASCLIIRRLAREIALFDVEVKNESAVKKS